MAQWHHTAMGERLETLFSRRLMRGIYETLHWDRLSCHYIHTKFRQDWSRQSKVDEEPKRHRNVAEWTALTVKHFPCFPAHVTNHMPAAYHSLFCTHPTYLWYFPHHLPNCWNGPCLGGRLNPSSPVSYSFALVLSLANRNWEDSFWGPFRFYIIPVLAGHLVCLFWFYAWRTVQPESWRRRVLSVSITVLEVQ